MLGTLPATNISDMHQNQIQSSQSSFVLKHTQNESQINKEMSNKRSLGDVVITVDLSGSLKIFTNPPLLKAGSSTFFSPKF